jgi:hypothetical protein
MATPYADLVSSLGGIAYWPLQDIDGTDAIGSYDLTWSGSPTLSTGGGPGGELANAVDFDPASNQWGSVVSDATLRPTEAITVIFWFNADSLTANSAGLVACGDTGYDGWNVRANDTNQITAQIKNGTDALANVNMPQLTADGTVWYFLAVTYDKSNLRTYENAEQTANSPVAATFSLGYGNDESLFIGNWDGNTGRDFDGRIAGVALFPSALTAANITDLYDAITNPPGQTLLPDADTADGGWTTTPLWSKVADADDGTVISATSS